MEKEIPDIDEKVAPGGRLREATRALKDLPLDRLPTDQEWEQAVGDLSRNDLDRLETLAEGHLKRVATAPGVSEGLEQAGAAVLLKPRDQGWVRQVIAAFRARGWAGDEVHAFVTALERRTKKPRSRRRWWPLGLGLLLGTVTVVTLVVFGGGLDLRGPGKPLPGPRGLEAIIDTQGVKSNSQVVSSRLLIFPEATVAELSAWVTFPDHRVEVWEGQVNVLGNDGQVLASREVTFHASSEAPLEAGQGVEVFQQFDAWPWFDRVTTFQVSTHRILAREAQPRQRRELAVAGTDALTPGYRLRVWLVDQAWSERFASRVHTLSLEVENAGLKAFGDLQIALVWVREGQTLKTQVFRPVSPFRTALPAGGRTPWVQETVFDTEVFDWPAGQDPLPVLELRQWK